MILDHSYNLTIVKDIKATDDFFSLDENVRGCQKDSKEDCTTMKYIDALENSCHCLPFQLRFLLDKV